MIIFVFYKLVYKQCDFKRLVYKTLDKYKLNNGKSQ